MAKNKSESGGKMQKLGLLLALAFYIISVIMVIINTGVTDIIDPDVKTLSFAHWQLEDGFREGYDDAIKRFQDLKAEQGVKVKIVQTTVPFRGYKQWFLTQLLGGSPADIIELTGSSEQRNQYFVPLSQYIGKPNPFNKGTIFEGIPWKDTFIDGMDSALDTTFGEYFGVGTFTGVTRIYVNMDLLEKATGSKKLPEDLTEWLEVCQKMRKYGEKTGKPIVPIGVRGFDKSTLYALLVYYLSQMNCNLNDNMSKLCAPEALRCEVLKGMHDKTIDTKRLYAAVDIIRDIGKYFGEGFSATDLEQTKFLFFAGNVGFFPEGSWNAYSMVNNSPFEVQIMDVPLIGKNHKYSKYFVGRPSEQGLGVGGQFGIPKSCKNFDIALEFLQFITSWKINQLIMVDYSKWPPAVKNAEYKGILEKFKPVTGIGRRNLVLPFMVAYAKSKRKMLESLEEIIIDQPDNAREIFKADFIDNIPVLIEETEEVIAGSKRALFSLEGQRSAAGVAAMCSDLTPRQRTVMDFRAAINSESLIDRMKNIQENQEQLDVLKMLQKGDK